jgi:predicted MFS family arabinose efflux permease
LNTLGVTSSPPSPSTTIAPLKGGKAVALVATLILGVLSYQLNATMISPAIPDMAKSLNVGVGAVSQVTSLFFLTGAIGGVVLSRWSDYLGRRKMLLLVLVILGVGTLLCVFAPNLTVLLIGRALQGASSAAFQLTYVILSETMSAKVFGTVLGVITAVNGGVGGVDGYVGGLLTDTFGFRSIFVVIFIIGVIALVSVFFVVPKDDRPRSVGNMDWWGAAALSIGLICVTYLVSTGSSFGWFAPLTIVYLVGTVVSFVGFWYIEKHRKSPLIAVQHLRSRQVWPVLATTVLSLAGIFAVINFTVVILSQDSKTGYGLNASSSALFFLAPAALIAVFAAPASGWLAGRRGWIVIARLGLVLSVVLLIASALFTVDFWVVFAAVALLGITYNGLVLTTINGLGVLLSPPDAPAALPGLNGAAFGIGASLGIAVVAPFVAQGTTVGYSTALWISVGITALALLASFFIAPRKGERI